jgi:hypothetical protein
MGSRETAVPLTRIAPIRAVVVVLWALALPIGASAQPTDLFICMPPYSPTCFQGGGARTVADFCSTNPPTARVFLNFFGRVAWYPLRCVGPITVAVETTSPPDVRYPLYVEIVPLRGPADFPYVCGNLPGNLVQIVYGHYGILCGVWDEVGPMDITRIVPLGSLYALRLYFFAREDGFSPAVGCVRVTAHPADTTAAVPSTWGRVKALYK